MNNENRAIKTLAELVIQEYQKIVDKLYINLLKINPEALRLYKPENIKVYRVIFNQDYFQWNDCMFFTYKRGGNLEIDELDLTDEKYYKHDTLIFDKTMEQILAFRLEELNVNDIIYKHTVFQGQLDQIIEGRELTWRGTLRADIDGLLRKETREFHSHNNNPQGYYAKNAAKFAYSELDLEPILAHVNDKDFSYQLDQAIAAYDNSLYLPACATLGVCLETVCKLLLKNNGIKVKDSDSTMLDQLSNKLKENHLINYKLKGRIDVCYKVRNLASHTSPGKIVKSDCHFILNTISEIVETHFNLQ
ncbi:hypothetical protein [Oceanobacillus profundus]|uniref:hypothetical protein n=1 Tax=Oceanobacillus TaxID=182709 RepID=UPI0026E12FC0|nr:hypothetical protein [Oceanobacillus profundus]MDO6448070.1 hypothetical protein [Oceanobacillus profundus]